VFNVIDNNSTNNVETVYVQVSTLVEVTV